jgi:hypothetical protein
MAMGSGAFLVQACRYLSERLVEAWDSLLPPASVQGTEPTVHITPEGKPATGDPGETIIPPEGEERLTLARRLVADRCLYGVDKNPLAVEMAKLSLWLITLDRNRSFTFLDHALKHGDSLIGADEDMFLRWAQSRRDSAMPLFAESLQQELETARGKRRELQAFEVREVADAERKAQLLAKAEAATERIKLGCDLLVGTRLLDALTPAQQDALLANALLEYVAGEPFQDRTQRAVAAARTQSAFHWSLEYPEVFPPGGFNAFVGNPPFLGGTRISTEYGAPYLGVLQHTYPSFHSRADLCSLFLLRAFSFLQTGGGLGLIATNTIAQGDTREAALDVLTTGGAIYRAVSSQLWPGSAAVAVSIIHMHKGTWSGSCRLDDEEVSFISPLLDQVKHQGKPHRLTKNSSRSFNGSKLDGIGFVVDPRRPLKKSPDAAH